MIPPHQMFFIHRGVVEVVSEDGSIVFDTMQSGRFFGEISLVFSCPRTASIRYAQLLRKKRSVEHYLIHFCCKHLNVKMLSCFIVNTL